MVPTSMAERLLLKKELREVWVQGLSLFWAAQQVQGA